MMMTSSGYVVVVDDLLPSTALPGCSDLGMLDSMRSTILTTKPGQYTVHKKDIDDKCIRVGFEDITLSGRVDFSQFIVVSYASNNSGSKNFDDFFNSTFRGVGGVGGVGVGGVGGGGGGGGGGVGTGGVSSTSKMSEDSSSTPSLSGSGISISSSLTRSNIMSISKKRKPTAQDQKPPETASITSTSTASTGGATATAIAISAAAASAPVSSTYLFASQSDSTKTKLDSILQNIKETIMINSNKLNIAAVNPNKNVRVFPRIYCNGGYRTYSSKFPLSADEEDKSTVDLAPNEIKVYFELFLNTDSDEWTDTDGGHTLIRNSDVGDDVISVSPKRNRLILVTLSPNQFQGINKVTSTRKQRLSLSGCFVCYMKGMKVPEVGKVRGSALSLVPVLNLSQRRVGTSTICQEDSPSSTTSSSSSSSMGSSSSVSSISSIENNSSIKERQEVEEAEEEEVEEEKESLDRNCKRKIAENA